MNENHPPIPRESEFFSSHFEMDFYVQGFMAHNLGYEQSPHVRKVIAAVAAAEWRKDARRYNALCKAIGDSWSDDMDSISLAGRLFFKALDDCVYYREKALQNASEWEMWGGWK